MGIVIVIIAANVLLFEVITVIETCYYEAILDRMVKKRLSAYEKGGRNK